ncbi:MAG: YbjN domain-containing protein [Armatimonadetes bacterium]|nr:YbjN domain-containing protein [Armatimonadota bacterium]
MSTTLKKVVRLLSEAGWHAYTSGDDTAVIMTVCGDRTQPVVAELHEDGRYLRFIARWFMVLPEGDKREALLAKLLQRNCQLKLLKFGLDPRDGEVTAEVSLPLMGGKLRPDQLNRVLWTMNEVLPEQRATLLEFLETGVDRREEQKSMDDTVRKLLEAGPAGDEDAGADELIDLSALPDQPADD